MEGVSTLGVECAMTAGSFSRAEVESPISNLTNGLTAFAFPPSESKIDVSTPLARTPLSIEIPTSSTLSSARKLFEVSQEIPRLLSPPYSRKNKNSPCLSPPKLFRSTSALEIKEKSDFVVRTKIFKSSSNECHDFVQSTDLPLLRPHARKLRPKSSTKPSIRRAKPDARPRPYPLSQPISSHTLPEVEQEYEMYQPKLPRISSDLCGVNTISCETVAQLLKGEYSDDFDKIVIVDCRFEYEHKGGHIKSSINIGSQEEIEDTFLKKPPLFRTNRTAMIFHCEFSKNRGPRACKHLRERDRQIHGLKFFPKLFYPELYVMAGGYKEFFSKYPELCEPQGYVSMQDPRFLDLQRACWKAWKMNKKEFSRSVSLPELSHESFSAKRPLTPSFCLSDSLQFDIFSSSTKKEDSLVSVE